MGARSYSSQESPSPRSRPVRFRATFVVSDDARMMFDCLSPEGENVRRLRSSYVLKMKKDTLTIKVEARDRTAFKATCNTLLKAIDLAGKISHG